MSDTGKNEFEIANALVQAALKSKKPYKNSFIDLMQHGKKTRHDVWKFVLPDFSVLYHCYRIYYAGKTYEMLSETQRLVDAKKKRIARRDKRDKIKARAKDIANDAFGLIGICGLFAVCLGLVVVCVGGAAYGLDRWVNKTKYKIDKQVQEYKLTLPDWNDSIIRATDDESLRRALDKREQVLVQLEHFRDSLEKVYSNK